MNPSNLVLQVGLAAAMIVGAIATVAFLLRQSSIRRRSGLPATSTRERGSNLQHAFGSEANAIEPGKLDESVLAVVKPIDLALHDLNKRVAELHARVDVSTKILTKLASPTASAEERVRIDTQKKERDATNAKVEELAQQLRVLTNEFSTLKRRIETPKKPEARSTAEKPEARITVEKSITLRPADTQKLAALLRAMTGGKPPKS